MIFEQNDNFWCIDCRCVRALDKHGYCGTCGSDALCIATPAPAIIPRKENQVKALEELMRLG